jgi:hypothetical protein
MREPKAVLGNTDGVPQEFFGSDTARINRDALHGLKVRAAIDDVDAVPREIHSGGDTMRLDAVRLENLIEESSRFEKPHPIGTPQEGLPKLRADDFDDNLEMTVRREPLDHLLKELPAPDVAQHGTVEAAAKRLVLPLPAGEEAIVEAAPAPELPPIMPVRRASAMRDLMIGGSISVIAMSAAYLLAQFL